MTSTVTEAGTSFWTDDYKRKIYKHLIILTLLRFNVVIVSTY